MMQNSVQLNYDPRFFAIPRVIHKGFFFSYLRAVERCGASRKHIYHIMDIYSTKGMAVAMDFMSKFEGPHKNFR